MTNEELREAGEPRSAELTSAVERAAAAVLAAHIVSVRWQRDIHGQGAPARYVPVCICGWWTPWTGSGHQMGPSWADAMVRLGAIHVARALAVAGVLGDSKTEERP